MNNKHQVGLSRTLKLKDAVSIGLGAIIGAGIFVVTGEAAAISGPSFIVGLAIAGIVASFNGISSAQLASVYPQSGGTYEYGYRILNPWFGFSAGWMFLLSKLSAAGIVAIGFGSYFHQLAPEVPSTVLSVFAILLLTLANYFGIQKVGYLNMAIVGVTVFCLIYLVISGIPNFNIQNFKPFAPFGFSGIAEASALLFFAFTGYARIATLAEEVVEPEKTIPRAILITIFSAIFLYIAVSMVSLGVIGATGMAGDISPLQAVASALNTPAIVAVVTLGASTAMLGVLLSQILGISRMMLAMGRRRDLIPALQTVNKKYKVPHIGIMVTGSVILLLTLFGSFDFIVRTASFTILLYYSITNLAALKQPVNQQIYGRIVPVLGLIGCLLMAISLPIMVILNGILLLVIGFILRIVIKGFLKS